MILNPVSIATEGYSKRQPLPIATHGYVVVSGDDRKKSPSYTWAEYRARYLPRV